MSHNTTCRTQKHVAHYITSHTASRCKWHLVVHDTKSYTTSRRKFVSHCPCILTGVIFHRRHVDSDLTLQSFESHDSHCTRHSNTCMSSPEGSQITLDLSNNVILDPSLHFESGSIVNYYNPLMSILVSKFLTFGDDVVLRSTMLCIQHFSSNVYSDSTIITSIAMTCHVLHSYQILDLAPTSSRSILQFQDLIHMSSSNFHSIAACYIIIRQVMSCLASSRGFVIK